MSEQIACLVTDLEPGSAMLAELTLENGKDIPIAMIRTDDGEFYAIDAEDEFDGSLLRIFEPSNGTASRSRGNMSAAALLAEYRTRLRRRTAKPLGVPAYVVDQVLRQLVQRARILKLRQARPKAETVSKVSRLVSRATVSIIRNSPRLPL